MMPAPEDDVTTPPPVALLAGTFAVYEDGVGGYVLVTSTKEHGERRDHIPRALVKLLSGGGLVGSRIRAIIGS